MHLPLPGNHASRLLLSTLFLTAAATAAADPARTDLDEFFCMNGIQPFHERHSDDAAVRDALWDNLDKRLLMAKELGIDGMRIDLWWGDIEPSKGDFQLDFPDRVIAAIGNHGLEPYPIFCYNSMWSPDKSPATPEEMDYFARYAATLAARYKGKVRFWEVWNEPNIPPFWVPTPDGALYADLLQRVYTATRKADPDARIVAMCTAGPDYKFIETAYRNGAVGHLDALSFHHYDSSPDETLLEEEIRAIKRIMERYGDDGKPFFITELGYSTGPSEVVKPSTHEDQAEWIVKSHLLAIAEDVQRFYYFKMVDDYFEKKPDGLWGLFEYNGEKKKSWTTYKTMTDRLKGARFVGRAHRMGVEFERRDQVEFQLYRKGEELLAVAWVRYDGEPTRIEIPSDRDVKMESLYGADAGIASPDDRKIATIKLTNEPVYLRNLSPRVLPLASVRFDPPNLFIAPGETRTVKLVAANDTDQPFEILPSALEFPRKGLDISFSWDKKPLLVEPGKSLTRDITVTRPADSPAFAPVTILFNDQGKYTYRLGVYHAAAFDVAVSAAPSESGGVDLTAVFQNQGRAAASGTLNWRAGSRDLKSADSFGDLAPGASGRSVANATFALGDQTIDAIVTSSTGTTGKGLFRIWGQPLVTHPIEVDAKLDDWEGIPFVALDPRTRQLKPDPLRKPLSPSEFSGEVAIAWTADALHLAANVSDPSPLLNTEKGTNLWRGDSIELYIGFGGPTRQTMYGPDDLQIGINPGDGGKGGFVWNWKPRKEGDAKPPAEGVRVKDAKVASLRTETGYTIEVTIPLASLGQEIQEGKLLGFDCHINNKMSPESDSNDAVLHWNGSSDSWRDPSIWGIASVLSPDTPR